MRYVSPISSAHSGLRVVLLAWVCQQIEAVKDSERHDIVHGAGIGPRHGEQHCSWCWHRRDE